MSGETLTGALLPMMDNFEFLDIERKETERRRREELRRGKDEKDGLHHRGPQGPDRDGDGILDSEDGAWCCILLLPMPLAPVSTE
mgnify:CR=1 FL=1